MQNYKEIISMEYVKRFVRKGIQAGIILICAILIGGVNCGRIFDSDKTYGSTYERVGRDS